MTDNENAYHVIMCRENRRGIVSVKGGTESWAFIEAKVVVGLFPREGTRMRVRARVGKEARETDRVRARRASGEERSSGVMAQ